MRSALITLMLVISASAGVRSGFDTLKENSSFSFTLDSILAGSGMEGPNRASAECGKQTADAELFFVTEAYATCLHFCAMYRFGTPRPFHQSRLQFSKYDFSVPLKLSDTSQFKLIDTINSTECILPSMQVDSRLVGLDSSFYVGQTNTGRYVLFQIRPIVKRQDITEVAPPYSSSYFNQLTVRWFVQSLPTPLFNTVALTSAGTQPASLPRVQQYSTRSRPELQRDLLGRCMGNRGRTKLFHFSHR